MGDDRVGKPLRLSPGFWTRPGGRDEVLLNNKHAVRLVTKAAQRTTLDEPLLS
jgi:hypothetical protein